MKITTLLFYATIYQDSIIGGRGVHCWVLNMGAAKFHLAWGYGKVEGLITLWSTTEKLEIFWISINSLIVEYLLIFTQKFRVSLIILKLSQYGSGLCMYARKHPELRSIAINWSYFVSIDDKSLYFKIGLIRK